MYTFWQFARNFFTEKLSNFKNQGEFILILCHKEYTSAFLGGEFTKYEPLFAWQRFPIEIIIFHPFIKLV
jgi:hypothetical protein